MARRQPRATLLQFSTDTGQALRGVYPRGTGPNGSLNRSGVPSLALSSGLRRTRALKVVLSRTWIPQANGAKEATQARRFDCVYRWEVTFRSTSKKRSCPKLASR